MVITANIVGVLQILLIAHPVKARQNLAAFHRMGFHDLKFLRRQSSRLVENRVRNRDFTDVVHGRCAGDHINVPLIQAILCIAARHVLQQHLGKHADPLDMLPGLHAPVLDNGGQGVDHHGVGFPQPGRLFGDQLLLVQPMQVQLDNVLDPPFDHMGFKGLLHDIGGPQVKGPDLVFHRILRRDHHHRNICEFPPFPHLLHHLIPVHNRHHQVQQQSGNLAVVRLQQQQRLFPVLRLQQIVLRLKHPVQNRPVDLHIIHNQDRIPLHHILSPAAINLFRQIPYLRSIILQYVA